MNLTIHVTVSAGGPCASLFPVALLAMKISKCRTVDHGHTPAAWSHVLRRHILGSAVRSLPSGLTHWSNRCVKTAGPHCPLRQLNREQRPLMGSSIHREITTDQGAIHARNSYSGVTLTWSAVSSDHHCKPPQPWWARRVLGKQCPPTTTLTLLPQAFQGLPLHQHWPHAEEAT